jgi:hypothetical protein
MKKFLLPVAIYVCFIATYISISRFNNNNYLFLPVWDIKHYLDISEIGYQVYPCTPGVDGRLGEICGNSGWLPVWPLVAKAVRPILGGSSQVTFIGLVFLFSLLGYILLYSYIRKNYSSRAAIITLAALSCSPSAFYLVTGFPYALFFLLFMAYLILLHGRPRLETEIALFLVAVALSLTYPTGFLLAAVPIVWFILKKGDEGVPEFVKDRGRLVRLIIPFVLGPLLLWTYFYFKFDDFFLQLHFQEKYHRTWAFPLYVMAKSLLENSLLSPENIVIIWYGLIFLLFIPYRIRAELWVLALIMYLFSPATGTTMSIYRHYLIIFPAYMMVGTSDRPLWFKLAFCLAGLIIALGILFPSFMAYRLI